MTGVKRFEDLDCYQLSVQIRREILRVTRRPDVRRDEKFCKQIRDSARSAPRNIAEGFSRFNPTEIQRYVSYAKASLDETKNHVVDGLEEEYFTSEECDNLRSLVSRTIGAILRWLTYLESSTARNFYAKHRAERRASEYVPHQRPKIPRARRSPPLGPAPPAQAPVEPKPRSGDSQNPENQRNR
jgi:four helix bundle protein